MKRNERESTRGRASERAQERGSIKEALREKKLAQKISAFSLSFDKLNCAKQLQLVFQVLSHSGRVLEKSTVS